MSACDAIATNARHVQKLKIRDYVEAPRLPSEIKKSAALFGAFLRRASPSLRRPSLQSPRQRNGARALPCLRYTYIYESARAVVVFAGIRERAAALRRENHHGARAFLYIGIPYTQEENRRATLLLLSLVPHENRPRFFNAYCSDLQRFSQLVFLY